MGKFPRLLRLSPSRRRRAMVRLAARVVNEDKGGEVLEYALVAGLIVVAAIGTISCVGQKIVGRWNSLNSQL